MRKTLILLMLVVAIAAADPFNTITAYTLTRGTGFAGPNVPVWVSMDDEDFGSYPAFWVGYGFIHRFDITFMFETSIYDAEFSLGNAMLEGRYELISMDMLCVSPSFDVVMPMDGDDYVAFIPGVMATATFPFLDIHANLFYSAAFRDSVMTDELIILAAPEFWIGKSLSLYAEANLRFPLVESDDETFTLEFWPGMCWYPVDWLSFAAACGLPPDFTYILPGMSAYIYF